jgi:ABC-type antimicrobial peptide transport system permease subunit
LFVVARTASDPAVTVGMMRQELRTIDSDVPVYQAGTMDDHVSAALALPRTAAGTLGLFGGLALLLAAMGLYAVVAFAVSRRTTEIGIRMALGASGSRVVATIAKDTLVVVGAGVVLGLVLSFMAAPVLESLLFNVPTTDLVTLAIVALFMALVAAFAAYLPARRAAHTDPMRALRFE